MNIQIGTKKDIKTIIKKYPHTKPMISKNGYTVIAISNHEIIGFASLFRRKVPAPIQTNEDFINVIEVFSSENRNRGVASAILCKCKEIAKENGSYQLRAYCDIGNIASHNLWLKNNFGISPVKNNNDIILGSYVTCVL